MEDIIKFLQNINNCKFDFSYEKSMNYESESALTLFESKIYNLFVFRKTCGYEYKTNNSDKYIKKYQSILFKMSNILFDIDHQIKVNCFENKQNNFKSFYDDIENLLDSKFNEKINKNNISKKIRELEFDLRKFVNGHYNNNIIYKEKNLINFIDEKIKSKLNIHVIDEGNNFNIKAIRYDTVRPIFEVKINNEWITPKNNSEAIIYARLCMECIIKSKLKNNNSFSKALVNKMYSDMDMMGIYNLTESIIKNKDILRNKNINTIKLINNIEYSIEDINDIVDKIEKVHSIEKYASSILSNKYKNLVLPEKDEEEYDYSFIESDLFSVFESLKDIKINHDKLQDFVGKKMASFKNKNDLKTSLSQLFNTYNNFNKETLLEKIKDLNADVIVNDNEILILKINDFSTSKEIGSSSWCISSRENNWNNYTKNDNIQYFYYDFYKIPSDKKSMIGITMENNKITAAHYKNDDYAMGDNFVIDIASKIIDSYKTKKGLKFNY